MDQPSQNYSIFLSPVALFLCPSCSVTIDQSRQIGVVYQSRLSTFSILFSSLGTFFSLIVGSAKQRQSHSIFVF